MQRTIKLTKFTYAESVLNEEGGLETKLQDITVNETNEKKALKKAFKEVGVFKPLKVEVVERLYQLDDEIFFKYAKLVDKGE